MGAFVSFLGRSDIYDLLSHDCEESRGHFFGETTETKTPKTTTHKEAPSLGGAQDAVDLP